MSTKSYKILSVLYVLGAVAIGLLLWFAWMWFDSIKSVASTFGITLMISMVVLIGSAVECWVSRVQRNVFQHILVWAPLVVALCLLVFVNMSHHN